MVEFKVCGLTRPEDARAAEEVGASYGGVVLAAGSPRTVTVDTASRIFAGVGFQRCGVFVDPTLADVLAASDALALAVVQLHGDETPGFAARVRERGVEVWKAVRPRTGGDFAEAAARYGSVVDGILLDGWSPHARGGTGTRFPWEEVARFRDSLDPGVRLIVAGGLNPDNVMEVITVLAPDVVDVSSGVEQSPGLKDHSRLSRFAAAVRGAGAEGRVR